MPIELKKIPEKIPLPEPPSAFRWFITIVLISVLGGILALYLWPEKMSTHSAWFWFCIFVIPLSTGLACYAFRLRAYENERDRVNYWNHLHQEQHDIQVKRGRRPAGLLGKAYITPIACNKLASALINHGSQLQSTYFAHFQQAFTTARLEPSTSHFLKEGYSTRLTGYITQLLRMLEPDLSVLPADRLSVRLRHDGSLDNMQITQIWQAIFPATYHMDSIVVPGGELHTDLMALLHVYLGSRLDVRLQLCVDRSLLPDATMSIHPKAGAVQLGRTAVMRPLNAANIAAHPKTITINLGRYERVQENIHRRETDEDGDYRW